MENVLYPAAPPLAMPVKRSPSVAFRKQVARVIFTIILFFFVYTVLLSAAAALATGCFYLGITLILAFPKPFVLVAALGLLAVGASIFFFLIKFIFAVSKDDNSSRFEITEQQEPELYAFIRRLTQETRTAFPHKIYLSDSVNASVFYNSSFWSMFFPVKKNLEIGLGLVNSVNISEFRAVMAHEFGHFSQRSMKLGSFTYNVNRVIYNMLYDNKGYASFLESWGNLHGILSIFASITVKIAEGIQTILQRMYTVVNKSYLSLSREMEFHADAVAASVCGGNNLVSALSRVEVASSCYDTAVNKANELLKQNKISRNIYSDQLLVFQAIAQDYNLPVNQQLPEVSYHFIQSFSRSRVNYKDQWASHPTLAERKVELERLQTDIPPDTTRAWSLFANPDALQEQMTNNLYTSVTLDDGAETYDAVFFDEWCRRERAAIALPAAYNGFYDGRYVDMKACDPAALAPAGDVLRFEEIFTAGHAQLQADISRNENDLVTVKSIRDRRIDVKTFDFDGKKYDASDAESVIAQLQEEIDTLSQQLVAADRMAFSFFLSKAGEQAAALLARYSRYRALYLAYEEYAGVANEIMSTVSPFYGGNLTVEAVVAAVASLKQQHEVRFRQLLQRFLDEGFIAADAPHELHNRAKTFLDKWFAYFIDNEFQSDELNELCDLVIKTAEHVNAVKFEAYKEMLEYQLHSQKVKNESAEIAK